MTPKARALAVALIVSFLACAPRGEPPSTQGGDADAGEDGLRPTTAHDEGRRRGSAPPREASVFLGSAALRELDPSVRALREARIATLKRAPSAPGDPFTFDATLARISTSSASASELRTASLSLAEDSAPIAYRRPLAFYRLAAGLGLHVVPATALRAISVGELGALLQADPWSLAQVHARARVQNDGTVDALLTAPALTTLGSPWTRPRSVVVASSGSAEVRAWERWAASPTPVLGERPRLLCDFVESLVIDYLAVVATRKSIVFFPEADALLLDDNRDAFPLHAAAAVVEQLLLRLRAVARFPRGLREALSRFDRTEAAKALAPGGFDSWLLSPRSLIELDERRISLLSLIEAQVAERGADGVLCL